MFHLLADADTWVQRMWQFGFPWWEFVVRGIIIYVFLLVALRLSGKRQVGQLAPFDLILLLVLSNAVQNAMNGGDNSVIGGIVSATTLIVINWIVSAITFRSKAIASLIEGRPVILVHNGNVDQENLRKVKLTIHELNASLRASGHACAESVRFAVLENTGSISVVGMNDSNGGEANHPPLTPHIGTGQAR